MLKCARENVISKSVQLILSHPSQNRLTAIIFSKRFVNISQYIDPIVSHSYTGYIFNTTLLLCQFYILPTFTPEHFWCIQCKYLWIVPFLFPKDHCIYITLYLKLYIKYCFQINSTIYYSISSLFIKQNKALIY